MGSLSELPRRPTQKKMKFFVLLTLAAVGLADYESKEMMSKWMQMKAMESCWGAENMKQYTVEMKKAIAKCSNEDAPELSLPPYRSSYRIVNAIINKQRQIRQLHGQNEDDDDEDEDEGHDEVKLPGRLWHDRVLQEHGLLRQDGQLQDRKLQEERPHVSVQADVRLLPVQEAGHRQPRPWRQARSEACRAEAPHGGQDRQHDLHSQGNQRHRRQQQSRHASHEEGYAAVHDAQPMVRPEVLADAGHLLRDGHQPAGRNCRQLCCYWKLWHCQAGRDQDVREVHDEG